MAKKEPKNLEQSDSVEKELSIDMKELKEQIYKEALEKIKQEMKEEEKAKDVEVSPKGKAFKRKEMLDNQMLVPVMNVTNGTLVYISKKTGAEFRFEKYGDIEYIELYELLTMRSSYRKFLDSPFIIVMDDEVADYLGLTKFYKNLTYATEIDKIFKLPLDQFQSIIESTPKGLVHLIVSKAREKLNTKKLDSVQKVKALEETFNVNLKE